MAEKVEDGAGGVAQRKVRARIGATSGDQPAIQKNPANLESRRFRRIAACASDVAPVHIDSHLVQRPEFPVIVELEPATLKYVVLGV